MSITRIRAWKPSPTGGLCLCQPEDPKATNFDVASPGRSFSSGYHLTFRSLLIAERVRGALEEAHEAGKKAAMKEFRQFLGLKN